MSDGDAMITFDLFPAKVQYPLTGSVEPVRAVLADGELTIWRDSQSGPEAVWVRPAISFEGAHATGFAVQVEDGIVVVTRSGKCGCGSKLKRFDPYAGRRPIQVAI